MGEHERKSTPGRLYEENYTSPAALQLQTDIERLGRKQTKLNSW